MDKQQIRDRLEIAITEKMSPGAIEGYSEKLRWFLRGVDHGQQNFKTILKKIANAGVSPEEFVTIMCNGSGSPQIANIILSQGTQL